MKDSKLNSMSKNIDEIKNSNQVQSAKLDNLTAGIEKLLDLATKNPPKHKQLNNKKKQPSSHSTTQTITQSKNKNINKVTLTNKTDKRIINYQDFKIITFNSKGLETNYECINQLVHESDIIFICELMHLTNQKLSDHIYIDNKTIRASPANKIKKKGRGSGGIAFIYNEEIKANCEFYRNRIAVLQMEKIVIIGVYMTYNNSTQKNQDDYNSDLQLIQEMTENFKKYKKNVIICGDFNTDMSRLDAFTYSLNYLLVYLKYSVADLLWHQDDSINYTFFSKITKNGAQTKTIKSWIDHFLIQQNMQFAIDCKITPMANNT